MPSAVESESAASEIATDSSLGIPTVRHLRTEVPPPLSISPCVERVPAIEICSEVKGLFDRQRLDMTVDKSKV